MSLCLLSWWCHLPISSSVAPFSSGPQSFPESGSFPMSQFFSSGDQSIGVSASASVLTMNIQDWSPIDGLVGSPYSPRDSHESSLNFLGKYNLELYFEYGWLSIEDSITCPIFWKLQFQLSNYFLLFSYYEQLAWALYRFYMSHWVDIVNS